MMKRDVRKGRGWGRGGEVIRDSRGEGEGGFYGG